MSRIQRTITFVMILVASIGISACASMHSTMQAANDEDRDSGLGGTGMLATKGNDTDNGLGGTGIIGEITGYGSIFVNGIEIEYNDETPFTVNGNTASPKQLNIGDVVEVLTTDSGNYTFARVINLRHEVIGVVESVDPETFSFTVSGQTVIQSADKNMLPEIGKTVAVSGFRLDEKTISSTRVTPVDVQQTLLRTHADLPFNQKTVRWLVQAVVKNGKATVQMDGVTHVFVLNEKTGELPGKDLETKILQIQKSASGQLTLEKIISPADMPRGKKLPTTTGKSTTDKAPTDKSMGNQVPDSNNSGSENNTEPMFDSLHGIGSDSMNGTMQPAIGRGVR